MEVLEIFRRTPLKIAKVLAERIEVKVNKILYILICLAQGNQGY